MTTAHIIIDLGFGDAGKGTMVDTIAAQRGSDLVVRFNGGAQAGHNVVTPDGRHHTFSQFGAATFLPGVRTLLGPQIAIHPLAMVAEAEHLHALGVRDAFERLHVDRRAVVTTPYQQIANRLRELLRGDGRLGSCGVGHGETVGDMLDGVALRVGELDDPARMRVVLRELRERKLAAFARHRATLAAIPEVADELACLDDPAFVDDIVDAFGAIAPRFRAVDAEAAAALVAGAEHPVFEGAQGVLLDEWYGFHPHTTWSTCTFERADEIIAEVQALTGTALDPTRLGVLRAFAVRHGAGPFPSESRALGAALTEPHNGLDPWQGAFRHGHFDALLGRYAIEVCGGASTIDGLAITHLDQLPAVGRWAAVERWRAPGIEEVLGRQPGFAAVPKLADSETIDALRPLPTPDLEVQSALTAVARGASPVFGTEIYSPSSDGGARVLSAIEDLLHVPVTWTSSGVTRNDKRERDRLPSGALAHAGGHEARPVVM